MVSFLIHYYLYGSVYDMYSTNMYINSASCKIKFTLLSTMVANQYLSQSSNRQPIKQPASVPFIWEVRPGLPKKDWKHIPSITPVNPIALPPVKLIDSDPFQWDEMPGKSLHCFPHEMPEAGPFLLLPTPSILLGSQSPRHTLCSQNIWDNADDDGCDGDDEKEEMIDPYLDAWGFEIDTESISSAPSLLANRLIPSLVISNAVPVEDNGQMGRINLQLQQEAVPVEDNGPMGRINLQLQQETCSPIYESDSSTSSYATGNTSLGDTPILERLFPLLLRKSSSLENLGCENGTTTPQTLPSTVPGTDPELVSDNNLVVKKPLTLGEQIIISRRRSYHRKAILVRDQNLSLEFMKKSVLGCCMVGSVNKMKRLQGKWKNHLQLKPS